MSPWAWWKSVTPTHYELIRGGPLDIQGGARSFFEKKCLSLSISKLKCLLPVVVKKKKFAHKIMENKMFDWTPWETPI